jgi:hypothetical protein
LKTREKHNLQKVQIHLDDYVSDADNADGEQTWSYSGNSELIVSIDANRIATITQPADWKRELTILHTTSVLVHLVS